MSRFRLKSELDTDDGFAHSGSHDEEQRLIEERRVKRQRLLETLKCKKSKEAIPPPSNIRSASTGESTTRNEAEGRDKPIPPKPELPLSKTRRQPNRPAAFDMFADDSGSLLNLDSVDVARREQLAQAALREQREQQDSKDDEGFYQLRPGEEMNQGKYTILRQAGKGVFSTVAWAKVGSSSSKAGEEQNQGQNEGEATVQRVAIKLIRDNPVMIRAAQREIESMQQIHSASAPTNTQSSLFELGKSYMLKLHDSFSHKNHLCLVFEAMDMDLREVLNTVGRGHGISIGAIRLYAKQLLAALYTLKSMKLVHADIKPDNILIHESKSHVKLCDFGSVMHMNHATSASSPYFFSRFYRAPEIILGAPFGPSADIWALGVTFYELYTGKFAFPGMTNNDMLWKIINTSGMPPSRMLRKSQFRDAYFDSTNQFFSLMLDGDTPGGQTTYRQMNVPRRSALSLFDTSLGVEILEAAKKEKGVLDTVQSMKTANLFANLISQMLTMDDSKRITPEEAMNHPFFDIKES